MKKVLLCLFILMGFFVKAQLPYNNEWIDYSKTYYKFPVGKTGLYRINQSVLASAGLGSVAAEQFQLWRNGKQVPIYTSLATGVMSGGDYIEFWGEMNDGKPDNELYRDRKTQLNDKWSLETDTATYFLTVNPAGNNLRLASTPNNAATSSLTPEPYFMHTVANYFKDRLYGGFAVAVAAEFMYSSAYDKAEGWASNDIGLNGTHNFNFNNLFVFTGSGAPSPKFKIGVFGNTNNARRYQVSINGDSIIGNFIDYFNHSHDSTNFNLSTISTGSAAIQLTNVTLCSGNPVVCPGSDRMVISKYELTYPRAFNFGGASNFEFSLPENLQGNLLEISNFSYGSSTPVLYDLTNGKRYDAIVAGGILKFALDPSVTLRRMVLVSEEASNVSNITSLQSRSFVNYKAAINQGDYLIITNSVLFNGPLGSNPVDDYRQYRSSAAGGSYNAKIYLIDQLIDQYSFGIKNHPASIRNFLRDARDNFSTKPKFAFLIGRPVNYVDAKTYENNPDLNKLNLVPTFGLPASDILLSAEPGDAYPKTPIGRLAVINGVEIADYLKKVKEYEATQKISSPLIADKGWMKNMVHIVGANEITLHQTLELYLNNYKKIIQDTLYGANVTTFKKISADGSPLIPNSTFTNLMNNGLSLITYFGHSSAGHLDFNLEAPEQYNNQGKYPMFIALGCLAGNYFSFNPARLTTRESLSENYVLAKDRGSIGFIASSHFGIVEYLNIYISGGYKSIAYKDYGKTIGEIMQSTIKQNFDFTTQDIFYARATCEETALHGDPAITLNPHVKPDYAIEDPMLKISPSFVSVAEQSFKVDAKFINLGKAVNKKVIIEVKRQYPDNTIAVIYKDTLDRISYADSISINVPISASRDRGVNKIIVTVDAANAIDELFETNNSVTKELTVYEDEARPISPFNFAIVNQQNVKLIASTANPFSTAKNYQMEIDTTALFNSPLIQIRTVNNVRGTIEFDPGITFTNNTVYYWRVSPIPTSGQPTWNSSSFIYIAGTETGYNQSHFYQHTKSIPENILLDSSSRTWKFIPQTNTLFVRNGVFPTTSEQGGFYTVQVNGVPLLGPGCGYDEIIINVIDPNSFKPWFNNGGDYASNGKCGAGRDYNYMYLLSNSTERKKAMDFVDQIPTGAYVVVRGNVNPNVAGNHYVDDWKADTTLFGSGNSLYHKLYSQGFTDLDSFYRPRSWAFVFKKNEQGQFTPVSGVSEGIYDAITMTVSAPSLNNAGWITSPDLGPAKLWKELRWNGTSSEANSHDQASLYIIGIQKDGTADSLLFVDPSQPVVDLSILDAQVYPSLRLALSNKDTNTYTPYQLDYWRVIFDPAPEGAIAPNLFFQMKDTILDIGEPIDFRVAFKNLTNIPFSDSLKIKMIITDRNNVAHVLPVVKQRPLPGNDTLHVRHFIDTKLFAGSNTLYIEVNPDNDQPEQYHFNNFIYKNFYVKADSLHPILDVTFDNVHILNHDIVSAKPDILIKLKDEAKWMLLNDSSLATVQIRYPNGTLKTFKVDNDTLRFNPAQGAPSANNTASFNLKPFLTEDGEYELIVKGKDASNNNAGAIDYRVFFQVYNKPMISNMLNYPNPFTTSTAFVFTITGNEVPQNIKIQILTVTGKIVREITKDELGPLRIGRNITEFRWDGTDQYGQKLGNGVYLYRVVTNLNGKSLDKFTEDTNTDRFFNKGYGKMYLMR